MFKNATPLLISILCAVSITSVVGLLIFSLLFFNYVDASVFTILFILLVCFLISYLITLYLLKRFIYRKVKLIYKTIHRTKRSSKRDASNEVDINSDIIEEVDKDVQEWANDQRKEIESLKTMETYRRNFLGNISHELNTPVFNIQGYVHTLLDGGLYDENININYLKRAANNVERLRHIISDLEAISQLEAGELSLDLQNFRIKDLALEVLEDLELMASERNITLSLKEGADSLFYVYADLETIRQVFTNLITNSIKYGKEGGVTKIGFYDMDAYLLIEVADNGLGIKEEHLSHVFDRFYRVDKSRSRQMDKGGSGLGLSIVKHIIGAHKQTINVRSTFGAGSTFGFTLKKAK